MTIRACSRSLLSVRRGRACASAREAARGAPEQHGDEHDGEGDPGDDHELGAFDRRDAGFVARVVDLGHALLGDGRRDRAADREGQHG